MTLQEMLKRFENGPVKDHIDKLREEQNIPKINIDQFIKDTELFMERMDQIKKYN
jgi:hypothetical protein|tara:strand:+ start:1237 stop:1401 length:165 start_codon:yes stop_codon:yes gene_type:complete